MTKEQLEQFKKWFYEYVATFYGNDELVNYNIKLKEEHTRRVCADAMIIADELEMNQQQKLIAETIALFHDVGRFEQFIKYRSYNDVGTENHSLLGLKILADKKILGGLDKKEKEIIETAIRFHGEKDLPGGLGGETELFAKLIRDTDKLDIYYVIISRLEDFLKNPEKAMATFGFYKKDGYSENIIEAIITNHTVGYENIKSINDMLIVMLGWVTDINFAVTFKEIKKRGLFEQIISFLPDTEDIHKVAKHVQRHRDMKIAGGQ
ncbi:MAG: HD domain-containing protein [Phycisphaerae bacterium]|jgi:hypothetical protein